MERIQFNKGMWGRGPLEIGDNVKINGHIMRVMEDPIFDDIRVCFNDTTKPREMFTYHASDVQEVVFADYEEYTMNPAAAVRTRRRSQSRRMDGYEPNLFRLDDFRLDDFRVTVNEAPSQELNFFMPGDLVSRNPDSSSSPVYRVISVGPDVAICVLASADSTGEAIAINIREISLVRA